MYKFIAAILAVVLLIVAVGTIGLAATYPAVAGVLIFSIIFFIIGYVIYSCIVEYMEENGWNNDDTV